MSKYCFHLLGNAHLDPVWLWNRQSGLNEGIATCRTIINLMKDFPELTFSRGEALIYEHIEKTDSELFAEIKERIREGRWEAVGGTYLQNDNNLVPGNVIRKNFEIGLDYFEKHLGVRPRTSWYADSFGHSAGLPDILADYGYMNLACTRPAPNELIIPKSAFWWHASNGRKILVFRPLTIVYLCERDGLKKQLDNLLKNAAKDAFTNIGVFYGLGDHGGGPTRRHIAEIHEWAAGHQDAELKFSTYDKFFGALRTEIENNAISIPEFSGEMNFCLRGCYASAAKFKRSYRKASARISSAEKIVKSIAANHPEINSDFSEIWKKLIFNAFHDILPGSSLKTAYKDQFEQLNGAVDSANELEFAALNKLAVVNRKKLSEPQPQGDNPTLTQFLVYNPLPFKYSGLFEIESTMDWRPIFSYKDHAAELPVELRDASGNPIPHQVIPEESNCWPIVPWIKRAVIPLELKANSWTNLEFGYIEGARNPEIKSRMKTSNRSISNGPLKVSLKNNAIHISYRKKSLFGKNGMSISTFSDKWGSWGGMSEKLDNEPFSFAEQWKLKDVKMLYSGSFRALMALNFKGKSSELVLKITLDNESSFVDFNTSLLWNETGKRLKLCFDTPASECIYEVPGTEQKRAPSGEVPGLRYVNVGGGWGFISDIVHCYSQEENLFTATVCRSARYSHTDIINESEWWKDTVDKGELEFSFRITADTKELKKQADIFENHPRLIRCIPG